MAPTDQADTRRAGSNRAGSLSRDEWVKAAVQRLVVGGIDAIKVEPLAASLGVTKGSFYHHFANRRELHEAVLAAWEAEGTADIIDRVESGSNQDPVARLHRLGRFIFAPVEPGDAIEVAIRAWAAIDPIAADSVTRVDERRLAYVVELAIAAGLSRRLARRRARMLYRTLIGEFVWRTSGGPATTRTEVADLIDLLFSAPER